MTVTIDKVSYPVVFTFPVLWNGWESDSTGYIVLDGDIKRLVLTDHSRYYFGNVSEIFAKLREYEEIVTETNKALKMLGAL